MQEACNDGIACIAKPHDEAPRPATRRIVPALPGSRPDGENTGMMRCCEPTCFIVIGLSHFFLFKEFEKGTYFVNLTWESEGVGHYHTDKIQQPSEKFAQLKFGFEHL